MDAVRGRHSKRAGQRVEPSRCAGVTIAAAARPVAEIALVENARRAEAQRMRDRDLPVSLTDAVLEPAPGTRKLFRAAAPLIETGKAEATQHASRADHAVQIVG